MPERVASTARRGVLTRFGSYFTRHAQTLIGSLGRLARQPFSTAMTATVIGIALALPVGLQLLVVNGRALAGRLDEGAELSVFLKKSVDLDAARAVAHDIEGRPGVAAVEVIPADAALQSLREQAGFGDALTALDGNPLPHALIVRPAEGHATPTEIEALGGQLRALPQAELVQEDLQWVRRFHALLEIVRRAVLVAGLVLAAAVLVVVGNTIRLDIQGRRDEIVIIKLIGGSDGFVRRPFLYAGMWYGLAGGLIAAAIVTGSVLAIREPVERLASLYNSDFSLQAPGAALEAALVAIGGVLGWAGSWIAAARHLRAVEPT
jgi:cell division transport system permease protein